MADSEQVIASGPGWRAVMEDQFPAILQLGRLGDVINVLPAARWLAQESGQPTSFVIDISCASILEGCSYVQPYRYPGQDYRAVLEAIRWAAQQGLRNVRVTQGIGHNWRQKPMSNSYAIDARMRCLVPDEAWREPVVFDRRDADRENHLLRYLMGEGPFVLFCGRGFSSPFRHGAELYELLVREVGHMARVIDIGSIRADRFYDLLALYGRAACLVTIDTATLHLAAACPELPVVALISDRYGEWSGTEPLPSTRVIYRCRYGDYSRCQNAIVEAVSACVSKVGA